jgi:tRNA(Ile2) C34 agmatinyltransferase TiaS
MPGKLCPKCSQLTFFEAKTGRKCSKCGYTMTVPPNEGRGDWVRNVRIAENSLYLTTNVRLVEPLIAERRKRNGV